MNNYCNNKNEFYFWIVLKQDAYKKNKEETFSGFDVFYALVLFCQVTSNLIY